MFKLLQLFQQALTALNQAAVLLGAGFFAGIGLLLFGNRLYWRLRARRLPGKVIGVREDKRQDKGVYYAVYRYALPTGKKVEATSDTGNNSLKGKATGHAARLLVIDRHPEKVADADSYWAEIIGGVLTAVGGVFIYIALTAWPVTELTWIMLAGVALYSAHRFYKSIPSRDKHPTASLSAPQRPANLQDLPVRPAEEIQAEQRAERVRLQQKTARIVTPILVVAGLGVLALGVHLGRRLSLLESTGRRTEGTVVSLQLESTLRSSSYYPIVRFRSADGSIVEFRDGTGRNPPAYHEGDPVTVLYLVHSPERSAIIDRKGWNWLGPVALCLFGTLLALVALRVKLGWLAALRSEATGASTGKRRKEG